MKTMVNDLKDQVTRMDREHEERVDRHREDIDWQREECILLRVGLQENKDRMGELSVRQQQMSVIALVSLSIHDSYSTLSFYSFLSLTSLIPFYPHHFLISPLNYHHVPSLLFLLL